MTIIVISEDNHGIIDYAKDYKAAVDYLFNEGWLSDETPYYDEETDTMKPLCEFFTETDPYYAMRNVWDIDNFNGFWDDCWYLEEVEVYE